MLLAFEGSSVEMGEQKKKKGVSDWAWKGLSFHILLLKTLKLEENHKLVNYVSCLPAVSWEV